MNIKIQQQHPSCVWLAKTGKDRKTRRQGKGREKAERRMMGGGMWSIGSQGVNLGWLIPLHKAACGVLCTNYHNHQQQCKWRYCESFQLSPSTHHTTTACRYDPCNSSFGNSRRFSLHNLMKLWQIFLSLSFDCVRVRAEHRLVLGLSFLHKCLCQRVLFQNDTH